MSKDIKIQGFPDVGSKLTAPSKKSVFERQKEQAEAKRLKEQQETAAVYEDFVKSFDDEGSDGETGLPGLRTDSARRTDASSSLSRRHFSSSHGAAGRGTRLSGPGSLGPAPPSFARKRTYEGSPPSGAVSQGLRAFDDGSTSTGGAFALSDDEDAKLVSRAEERAKQKPTIHMSSLPPTMSPNAIRAILPLNLTVDGVRMLPTASSGSGRRSLSAIVTLAAETPASDLDTAVSALQNRYLGRGFYLSLSRHLSSAVIGSSLPSSTSTSLPFGAKPTVPGVGRGQLPPRGRGGFAPPPSLLQRGMVAGQPPPGIQVEVVPPADLKQLKLIHKMLELVVTNGPEFEALLMSRPAVQTEERWAWLWDPTSTGGIWYRWRLWEILTQKRGRGPAATPQGSTQYIFEHNAPWVAPDRPLPFEYVTRLEEFVTDSEYNTSEDEDSGDEGRRRLRHLQGPALPSEATAAITDDGPSYLNPVRKAKLVHLLSRLPDSTAKLRRGDVARVTAFAIQHAGTGAEEVVDLLTTNVHRPFALNSGNQPPAAEDDMDDGPDTTDDADPSSLKLIALYLISDTLSSSSTSGVRHAWRYRQLFETALNKKRTFEHLGRLDKQLQWGRLRAEKWRRAIGATLSLWEGWSVFTAAAQEAFTEAFAHPPLTAAEQAEQASRSEETRKADKVKSRWKTVADKSEEMEDVEPSGGLGTDADVEAVDGEPMDEDLDGVPMEDSDEEIEDQREAAVNEMEVSTAASPPHEVSNATPAAPADTVRRRQRPSAADMFGDSDGE